MIIPKFWASAKRRHRTKEKRATIQRWGWSNVSQEDAQKHAELRVDEAVKAMLSTWPKVGILRREPKVAYNGAEGVPIREEVIVQQPHGVITRNGYGALCLNTPSAMFVDIDEDDLERVPRSTRKARWVIAFVLALIWWSAWVSLNPSALNPHTWCRCADVAMIDYGVAAIRGAWNMAWRLVVLLVAVHVLSTIAWGWILKLRGGALGFIKRRLAKLEDPGYWAIYETPAGLRLLALHQSFNPADPQTVSLMEHLNADPIYAAMCRRQNCFRARVSAKPWRIPDMERMRGPVWPVEGMEAMEKRRIWTQEYHPRAQEFAACAFIEYVGDESRLSAEISGIQYWHDNLCQAHSGKPLA